MARACGAALAVALAAAPAAALEPPEEERVVVEQTSAVERVRMTDDHDPLRAAHPLRIVAYAVHPVGVALDWVLVRPAVWVVRHEPFRTLFGYQD